MKGSPARASDIEMMYKGQDARAVFIKPIKQILGRRVFGATAPCRLRRLWRWIGGEALLQNCVIPGLIASNAVRVKCIAPAERAPDFTVRVVPLAASKEGIRP
jgi:hypothetical protein